MRPILQSSCAVATSAAEARFRIDAPVEGRRGTRVVALDDGAATLVRRLARESWNAARFFTLVAQSHEAQSHEAQSPPVNGGGPPADMALHRTDGTAATLADELGEADVAVMVATTNGSAPAAAVIGRACARRGVMTAGLVLGEQHDVADTVTALRPHAQVLLVTRDEQDVAEVLSALRA
ncbi:MAG: 3-methyl-2-oxobutanoate hydroxymethyltransferase [Pseudonocardia sp.]|nr:3-methyl-2-oxobutanoate hydroxymethyltransferase [Pseudonocardia sp.]